MKYFEKEAGLGDALRGIGKGLLEKKQATGRIEKLYGRKAKLERLEHTNWPKYDTKKVQDKIRFYSRTITGTQAAINRMGLPKLGSTTSPFQGTMLNVQTREAQRKYKSKILGKKRADILVPLWN